MCECDHLTDFMVIVVPQTWEEFEEYALQGLEINTFTWDEAMVCLDNPSWERFPFVYAVVIVLVVIEVIGVMEAVQRDNKELKQIEALVAARTKDRGKRIADRLKEIRRQREVLREAREATRDSAADGDLGRTSSLGRSSRFRSLSRRRERQPRTAAVGDFVIGDRVAHPVRGAGNVQEIKPDLSVVVAFDLGDGRLETHTYKNTSQWKLKKVFAVGERVFHPARGFGTATEVKPPDGGSVVGSVVVAFDGGETHTYKDTSQWKLKKMESSQELPEPEAPAEEAPPGPRRRWCPRRSS